MITLPEDVELAALALLSESQGPVGSLRLAQALSDQGIVVAEATAGRYLSALQRSGLTTAAGPKRGRTITAKGRRRLVELRRRRLLEERGASVAQAVRISDVDDLVSVLQVRRGLEAEAARLAALRADDRELQAIAAHAERHLATVESGSLPSPQDSSAFHLSIAQASHNPVLISVATILMDPGDARRLRSGEEVSLRAQAIHLQATEHVAITRALLERDADAAERLMREHVSHFLEAAERVRGNGSSAVSHVGI